MRHTQHLVIFVKAPRIGRAKTRLARGLGKVGAQRFYRNQLDRLCRRLCGDPRWTVWIALTDHRDRVEHVWDQRARVIVQPSGDLGQRMGAMFNHLPPGPLVLIGSDIPDVTADLISRAFRKLGNHDVVFGPGDDGGYWLVGARRMRRIKGFFDHVRWSGPHALNDTRSNLGGLKLAALPVLADIDTVEDYRRWQHRERNSNHGHTE